MYVYSYNTVITRLLPLGCISPGVSCISWYINPCSSRPGGFYQLFGDVCTLYTLLCALYTVLYQGRIWRGQSTQLWGDSPAVVTSVHTVLLSPTVHHCGVPCHMVLHGLWPYCGYGPVLQALWQSVYTVFLFPTVTTVVTMHTWFQVHCAFTLGLCDCNVHYLWP